MEKVTMGLNFGHGGKDTGAIYNGMREKDIVLNIGLKLKRKLEQKGIQVISNRVDDTYFSTTEICNYYNNKNNVEFIISLHCNFSDNLKANGIETLYFPSKSGGSKTLANNIHNSIVSDKVFKTDRKIKPRTDLRILKGTKQKCIIIELGFITNQYDRELYNKQIEKIVDSLYKAILNYKGIKDNEQVKKEVEQGFYRVVTDSYKSKSGAEERQKQLKMKGIDSFIAYYKE